MATISFPLPAGYVDSVALPDTVQCATVDDAAYHTVHDYPGGVSALAVRMAMPVGTLTHKANTNNDQHFFRPHELVKLQHFARNAAVLHAMAAQLGYTCSLALPDQAGGDPVDSFMHLQCAIADFVKALADPQDRMRHQPGTFATGNECKRAEMHLQALIAAATHASATLRAQARPVPVAGG